jgi:hypothetical protein
MFSLLKQTYDRVEETKGRKLINLLLIIFVVFVLLGLLIGYFTSFLLNRDELDNLYPENGEQAEAAEVEYEGRIRYLDPMTYPNDDISYVLVDNSGREIILLRATDQKLVVAEGHNVTVYGTMQKTSDGQTDVLLVKRVGIKNVSD